MELRFRSIEIEDYSKCADILMAAYKGDPWNNEWTKEEARLRIEATMSGFNSRGYVIEENNDIIAMCLGRIDYYYGNWSQYCIDEFNVDPNHQGRGVVKELLRLMTNTLKKEEINSIFLITGGKQAATFYEKNGFIKSNGGTMMAYDLQNDHS